jgi:hypothetical protein
MELGEHVWPRRFFPYVWALWFLLITLQVERAHRLITWCDARAARCR